ncbi:Holliday junction resolvase RuvX [Leifsonia poae]|uniref:Putative pre-16S rRNA nuclease n=1 Tax=Leifsonia poae TaxID=110933 RepID=A0A9W6M1Y1_9MICO|nr:Holliday junction resolvase RuvX [Leifsonia poae]GLJ78227.1 putative pre-16S rRNA nuclease [Leifsonia poae]
MRTGVRLGIDVGKVRIGVSRSDPHGMLATPVETVPRSEDAADRRRIAEIMTELGVFEIIVGLPLALSGAHTASTADAIGFATALEADVDVPVRLVDERLSTVSAHSALRASGKNSKSARPVVDQVAATIILQHALDAERATGHPPGSPIEPSIGP